MLPPRRENSIALEKKATNGNRAKIGAQKQAKECNQAEECNDDGKQQPAAFRRGNCGCGCVATLPQPHLRHWNRAAVHSSRFILLQPIVQPPIENGQGKNKPANAEPAPVARGASLGRTHSGRVSCCAAIFLNYEHLSFNYEHLSFRESVLSRSPLLHYAQPNQSILKHVKNSQHPGSKIAPSALERQPHPHYGVDDSYLNWEAGPRRNTSGRARGRRMDAFRFEIYDVL